MHGSIFSALRNFVVNGYGADAWTAIGKAAGLEGHVYLPSKAYPDNEVLALVDAASRLTGVPVAELLSAFGEFLAPALLRMYAAFVQPEWKTLDVIESTESMIHRVVRMREPDASPPRLECSRPHAGEVVVTYDSERRLCGVAIGIIRGLAAHYQERVVINEPQCMLRGDAACVISVQLLS